PMTMIVAVPFDQHSPMFGHIDSSQTVARRCFRTVSFTDSYAAPDGSFARSHGGFGADLRSRRSSRVLTPFLIAENPWAVRYFAPETTTGIARSWSRMLLDLSLTALSISCFSEGCYEPLSPSAAAQLEVHHPGRRGTAPRGARRALEAQAPGSHAGRRGGGRARRPLGERRVHLRQEAARRDRPPRALPAQAPRRHDRRRRAAGGSDQDLLRRVVRARGRRWRDARVPARRARRGRRRRALRQHGLAARAGRARAEGRRRDPGRGARRRAHLCRRRRALQKKPGARPG